MESKVETYVQLRDSLNHQRHYISQLEQSINNATETIGYLNSAVVIFSILIALVAIITPIWVGWKTNRVIKDFNKDTEERIKEYFNNKERREIDEAIELIASGDRIRMSQGFTQLYYTKPDSFTDEQILYLTDIAEDKFENFSIRGNLANILVRIKHRYVKKFFAKTLKAGYNDTWDYIKAAILYYSTPEMKIESTELFKMFINNSSSEHVLAAFKIVALPDNTTNEISTISLLNDDEIIEKIKNYFIEYRRWEKLELKEYFKANLPQSDYTETIYHQKMKPEFWDLRSDYDQ